MIAVNIAIKLKAKNNLQIFKIPDLLNADKIDIINSRN